MKRLSLVVLVALGVQFIGYAQRVTVDVRGIRNAKGSIMVMAQVDEKSKPIYGMAQASQGSVTVVLENVPSKTFLLSVFHDEDGDWKMAMDDKGRPTEGYARENCLLKEEGEGVKVKLYYPAND